MDVKGYTLDEIDKMVLPPKPTHAGGPGTIEYYRVKKAKALAAKVYIDFPEEPKL